MLPAPRPDPTADAVSRPTRERILDTAERLFAENGFAGTAVRDIAAQVGLNAASLYNHFPGKEGLYEAVLERGLRPLFELVDELADSDWTPARLDRMTDAVVTHLAERPQVPRLIMYEVLAQGSRLTPLTGDWLRPLYARALATFRRSRTPLRDWHEDEVPLLLLTLHHVILGYFAAAPLLREVFGEDPLSEQAIELQRGFARKVVRRLLARDERGDGGPPQPREPK
jgi:AcrR family transcriptional regulator